MGPAGREAGPAVGRMTPSLPQGEKRAAALDSQCHRRPGGCIFGATCQTVSGGGLRLPARALVCMSCAGGVGTSGGGAAAEAIVPWSLHGTPGRTRGSMPCATLSVSSHFKMEPVVGSLWLGSWGVGGTSPFQSKAPLPPSWPAGPSLRQADFPPSVS